MMNPTQQNQLTSLFRMVTSERALHQAWDSVKPRVVKSRDPTTRAAADEFGKDLDKSIRLLQRALRRDDFVFEPQRGVLKYKKGDAGAPQKPPRPIVVAPVVNRIVQRALLDICQSEAPQVRKRLGLLPRVVGTKTSVGGLPERGVPDAMVLITEAIDAGAKWFVRSDLKGFFQTIPKPRVLEFMRANVADEAFVHLFMRALETELSNEDEVRELISLFPIGDIGVPQGSALSALCANIVLAEFDAELNSRGLCTIRYLDDFVILGRDQRAVDGGWERAKRMLTDIGMECHDPAAGTGKAARGRITDGCDYLSFHFDSKDLYPTTEARRKFLRNLDDEIRDAKKVIQAVADEPRRAEPRYAQSLVLLDKKIRGWGDAFQPTTKRIVFAQLDSEVDKRLASYRDWFGRLYRIRSASHGRRLIGIALLADTQPPSPRKSA